MIISVPVCNGDEIAITEANLSQLKGKWEGYKRVLKDFKVHIGKKVTANKLVNISLELEIFNEELPLKGNLSLKEKDKDFPFDNGVIENGKLFIKWKNNWVRLSLKKLSEAGRMELSGEDADGGDYNFKNKIQE